MDVNLERSLMLLKAQKHQVGAKLRRIDAEIGRVAEQALESSEYVTKSSLARLLGLSHTHVGNLIALAAANPAPEPGIAVMDNVIAGDYVASIGASIVRSVSAFAENDVLVQTGVDPRLIADEGAARPPAMMWLLDTGEWIGVSQATVGYGGVGCGLAINALTRAGVDRDVASEIVSWRFCDAVDITDPNTWITQRVWPRHARSAPYIVENHIVSVFGQPASRRFSVMPDPFPKPELDETGFYPSKLPQTGLDAWLDFLDGEDLPDWARGPRVARCFRSDSAAFADGFAAVRRDHLWRIQDTIYPSIVIEQGTVQLWGFYVRDSSRYLPEEAYEVLSRAGVYPSDLASEDERAAKPWSRFIAAFGSSQKFPDRIDISETGQQALDFTPSEPIQL